jgi:hypothetical protein
VATFIDTRGQTKLAIGICARCSVKMPYSELVEDGNIPGLWVCEADRDPIDPWRLPPRQTENITLEHARPDVDISSPGPSPNLSSDPIDGVKLVGYVTTWQPSTPYAKGASVTPLDINDANVPLPQNWFLCVNAGTSGATVPHWPAAPGVQFTEGGVTWLNLGIYVV